MKQITREEWLEKALIHLQPLFNQPLPKNVKVSCGFPFRRAAGLKNRSIGECWTPKASKGNKIEIFISPTLEDSTRVLDVLVHELVHATVGNEAGHGGEFKRMALHVGLTGKMTATTAGESLTKRLNCIVEKIGKFPHAALTPGSRSSHKKDTIRMLKLECPDCGYVVRTTQKWLDVGMPTCVCGSEFEQEIK